VLEPLSRSAAAKVVSASRLAAVVSAVRSKRTGGVPASGTGSGSGSGAAAKAGSTPRRAHGKT
jgi:hypothetical protein